MIISNFESTTKAYINPEDSVEATWDEIAEKLTTFHKAASKEQVRMFNLWQFKPVGPGTEEGRKYKWDEVNKKSIKTEWTYRPNTIRRCAANAIGLWGIVLDYDNGKTFEEIITELDGLEYVFYTSYRHTPEHNKFRVVLPFDRMMTKAEFESKMDDIATCFTSVDPASFSQSQAIYLHSGPSNEYAIAYRAHGAMLSPDMFKDKVVTPTPVCIQRDTVEVSDDMKAAYKAAVLDSVASCRGIHRAGKKGDGGGLTLALICKSVEATFAEFSQICSVAAALESCLHDTAVQEMLWDDVSGNKIKRVVRDNFIKRYGGKPIKLRQLRIESRANELMKQKGIDEIQKQIKALKEELNGK